MLIREAVQQDLPQWAEMRSLLWPQGSSCHAQELADYFRGHAVDIKQAFVLDAEDGCLAGFMELNIRSFAEGSRAAAVPYLEAWFVRQTHRGHGHGKRLLATAEQWALQQGYCELASDTTPDNHHSIALHKASGFEETERLVCFLKSLQ